MSNMMKRSLAMLVVLVLCLSLCACRRVIGVDTAGLQHITMTYPESPEIRMEFTAQLPAYFKRYIDHLEKTYGRQ